MGRGDSPSGVRHPGHVVERAGGDGVDDLLLRRVRPVEHGDPLAEPEHGDPVGDLEDVVEVVRDDHDAQAALGQPAHEVEHLAGLGDAERGGRLVEDDAASSST